MCSHYTLERKNTHMRIWFGTTTLNYVQYKDYYLMIRKYLINAGHVLTDDWIGDHGKWIEENPNAKRGIRGVYEQVIKAIDKADVSIIEFTVPNFSTSHQITYSLQKRIPTLVMRLHREGTFKDSYIEALDSPYLKIVNYDSQNYKELVDEFLGFASMEEGQGRYNIILGKKHKYFLDWAANKYKKSRSEIIRELLEEVMRNDERFRLYLKEKLASDR